MNILVTGGAGYVGSHAAHWLQDAGHDIWIYDNLSTGHRQAALPNRLIEGELADQALLATLLAEKQIDVVMHFAAALGLSFGDIRDPNGATLAAGRA